MTLRFVPYRAWHLRALIVQPRQAGIAATLQAEPNYPESLERPHALTVMIGQLGRDLPVACGGIVHMERHRAYAWALISTAIPKWCWPMVVRRVAQELQTAEHEHGWSRIETHCDPTFPETERLADLLGFQREGIAFNWYGDGRNAVAYARTNVTYGYEAA